MKKVILSVIIAALAASLLCVAAFAKADPAEITVTIADKDGNPAVVCGSVTVEDLDEDGTLTIDEALYAAHEKYFEGGAEAGYRSENGQYGLSLVKLWGEENGGSYGYYVNDTSAFSLADAVKEGDYICAFVYTDLTSYSDKYTFFDTRSITDVTEPYEAVLTLCAVAFDENYAPYSVPVAGAVITINGEKTEFVTDSEGKVTVTLSAGWSVISAVSDTETLVPAICVAEVKDAETEAIGDQTDAPEVIAPAPQTSDISAGLIFTAVSVLAAAAVISRKR